VCTLYVNAQEHNRTLFMTSVLESSNDDDESTLCEPAVDDGSDHSDEDDVVPIGDDTDDVDVETERNVNEPFT